MEVRLCLSQPLVRDVPKKETRKYATVRAAKIAACKLCTNKYAVGRVYKGKKLQCTYTR